MLGDAAKHHAAMITKAVVRTFHLIAFHRWSLGVAALLPLRLRFNSSSTANT